MNKKISILIILFLLINSLVGCARNHVYLNEDIKAFEKNIITEYTNINRVQVKRTDLVIFINYALTNPEMMRK